MLYFGGSWCPPCLEELPRWKRIAQVCSDNGIQTKSIAVQYKETEEEAIKYLQQNVFPGEHIVEGMTNSEVALHELLQISSFPTYIFIDTTGEIRLRVENRVARETKLPTFLSAYIYKK
ncbi:MAG: TlpA disulfide reductase family protein [Saprospiraceae bacterium]